MTQKDAGNNHEIWYERSIVHSHYLSWSKSSGYHSPAAKTSFYAALEGEGIKTRRPKNVRQILCHFEIPRLNPEDRQILKLITGDLMEQGENDASE
jgi:hypothetical protein